MKMKIKTIEVYGFGKWVNQTFESVDQLQIFYGANEAGKTTLMAFIHSILFGFPTKQSSELRYEPRSSVQYGGRLTVYDTVYGEATIERIKGKGNGEVTVTLANGETGSDALLEKIVYGVDKATYQALFSFNLFGLQRIQQMNRSKLNRYFLSVGTLGNEQLLKVADKFQADAGKLYKQTGRVPEINQKMREIEEKKQQVRTAKAKNDEYTTLYTRKEKYEQEIAAVRGSRDKAEKQLEQLSHLAANWQLFSEMLSLQQEIKKMDLVSLPEDGLYQLNHLNQSIEHIRMEIVQEKERSKQIMEKNKLKQSQQVYLAYKEDIQDLMAAMDTVKETLQEKEFIEREIQTETNQFVRSKLQLGLNVGQTLPLPQTEEQKKNYHQLYQVMSKTAQDNQMIEEKSAFLTFQENSLTQQLDKIEPHLWENQHFQETESYYKNKRASDLYQGQENKLNKRPSKKQINPALFSGSIGLIIGIIGSFMNGISGIGLSIIGILMIVLSVLWGFKKNQAVSTETQSGYTYEEYIKQKELRKQWRGVLAEFDHVMMELKQINEALEKNVQQKSEFEKNVKQIIEANHYPENFSISDLVAQPDPFELLREQNQSIEKNEETHNQLTEKLAQWKERAWFLESVIFVDWNHIPAVIAGITQFYQEAVAEEQKLLAVHEKEEERQKQIKKYVYQLREFEQQRLSLFQVVKAKDEQDFRKKFVLFDQWKQKKDRLALLKQQVSADIDLLEQYRDQTDLLEQIEKTKHMIQQYKKNEEQQINQKIKQEVAMKELEKGGAYSVLLQEYANLKSELQELVDKWATYKVAADLIERALTHARKNRFPETIQDTTTFFKMLTKNNYQNVFIKENRIEVKRQDGVIFDAAELSQGTAEQLYVALRFAFVKNASDIVCLPLMIDDGFVNFDQSRKTQMLELMKQVSETTQVLYFTFDEQMLSKFRKEQIEMLY